MTTTRSVIIELKMTRQRALAALFLLFLTWHPAFLGSENIVLTTYYPAPYGGYAQLLTTGNTYLARDGGNVGIGTAAPNQKLHVNGVARATELLWGAVNGRGYLKNDQGGSMELGGSGTPYIDFSLNSWQDYSARLVLSQANRLQVAGDFEVTGSLYGVCERRNYWNNSSTHCGGSSAVSGRYTIVYIGDGSGNYTSGFPAVSGIIVCCKLVN
jgi:hypothetical protein